MLTNLAIVGGVVVVAFVAYLAYGLYLSLKGPVDPYADDNLIHHMNDSRRD